MSDQELKHEQSRNHALVERPTELKKEVARDDSKGSIKDRLVEMQNLATAYDETEAGILRALEERRRLFEAGHKDALEYVTPRIKKAQAEGVRILGENYEGLEAVHQKHKEAREAGGSDR